MMKLGLRFGMVFLGGVMMGIFIEQGFTTIGLISMLLGLVLVFSGIREQKATNKK